MAANIRAQTLPLQLEPEFMTPQEFVVDMEDEHSQVSIPTLVHRYQPHLHEVFNLGPHCVHSAFKINVKLHNHLADHTSHCYFHDPNYVRL